MTEEKNKSSKPKEAKTFPTELVGTDDAAEVLGTTRPKFRLAVTNGWVPYLSFGGRRKYRLKDLVSLAALLVGTKVDPSYDRVRDIDIRYLVERLDDITRADNREYLHYLTNY